MKTTTTELFCQSLLESRLLAKGAALVGIGVIGLVAAGKWAQRSRTEALVAAVETLNQEIAEFLESGGCLDGLRGVEVVISHLMQARDGGDRVAVVMQSETQAETVEARAVWDPRVLRLQVVNAGGVGAREFEIWIDRSSQVAA